VYWVANSFIFRRKDTFIHRLDPRVKLLLTVEFFSLALLSSDVTKLSISLVVIFSIAVLARILRRMSRTLLYSAGFSILIFVINFFVCYTLVNSIVLAVRFIAIVGSTSLFFLTTSPDELEHVLKWFRFPQDIVFAFVTAVRFVPVLMMDAIQIMDAQRSRGLELDKGNFLSRLKRLAPILIPLVVAAVIRSGELAEAMEARAYGAVKKPTTLYSLIIRVADKVTAIVSILVFGVLLAFYLGYLHI
jgi:energy-coupling factor transport system permease protein